MVKAGFIGTGNMGGSLARAAAMAEGYEILLSNRTQAKAQALAAELGASVSAVSNREIAEKADFIFLGVKPQMMADMLLDIAPVLKQRADKGSRFVLVTMAAGLTIGRIAGLAGGPYPVIRIMPNTPVAVGEGVILYAAGSGVSGSEVEELKAMLGAAGVLSELPEGLIDAGSAISGCGPAFVYMFIEALADGGVQAGLPRAKAVEYAAQMAAGSARLVLDSGSHPGVLKDAVCSPGGTTIEGVRTLEKGAFRGVVMDAVIAAYEKNKAFK